MAQHHLNYLVNKELSSIHNTDDACDVYESRRVVMVNHNTIATQSCHASNKEGAEHATLLRLCKFGKRVV